MTVTEMPAQKRPHYLLAAGGDSALWPASVQQQLALTTCDFTHFVGIDRGALHLVNHGVELALAVGDFDSLQECELAQVRKASLQVLQAPCEKSDTDTQLALSEVFKRSPEASVTLIGFSGGRLDHLLANLWLVLEARFTAHAEQLYLCDNQNSVSFYLPGEHHITQIAEYDYLTFACLTAVEALTLRNCRYPLTHHNTTHPYAFVSNEFIADNAQFSFTSGIVAVIQSRDLKVK